MAESTMAMTSWAFLSVGVIGLIFIACLISLVVAMFSRRPGAVLAGIVGMLLLLVGGVLLMVALWFVRGSASEMQPATVSQPLPVEQHWGPIPVEPPVATPVTESLVAEAPDASADFSQIVQETAPSTTSAASSPPRPAWMDSETGRVGDVYRTRVTVGPWLSRNECERELPEALRQAVRTYADHFLGEGKGQYVNLPMSYIRDHIVRGEWEERRQQTIDVMTYLHELLEFDADARQRIEAEYKDSVVMGRLGYTAVGGGTLLGLLTILFGCLKLDTLTRGYYTGRLRLTAAAAILALAAIAGLLVIA